MKNKEVQNNANWDLIIKPKTTFFKLNISEVWNYKDLILLLVKRDITAQYKQSILGPIWMFMQPLLTTVIYTFTFSVSAKLSTDEIPPVLFYIIGQTLWLYFSECFNKTSNTFISNASIFGKVYFPRLVMPLSVIISNLLRFCIQLILLLCFYLYYFLQTTQVMPQYVLMLLLPLIIIILGLFSLSLGILFTSITTKYRDFNFLLVFGVQLLMFASCVTFPLSMYPEKAQTILVYNPIVICMESFKYILTGHGFFSLLHIVISTIITLILLLISVLVFNRTEKSFMDSV